MGGMKWFRMYAEAVDDEKLRLLAFEDRWHFVALLCMKSSGVLDDDDNAMRWRKAGVKLGLTQSELENVSKRLSDVGLIDQETLQPLAWDRRQFQSDSSTDRVKAYRERMKRYSNVSVTTQDTETETETEKNKRRTSALAQRPDGVDDRVWSDFIVLRKAHRAPVTESALRGIDREAKLAGVSLQAALQMCCERGWRGFKADWAGAAKGPPKNADGTKRVAI